MEKSKKFQELIQYPSQILPIKYGFAQLILTMKLLGSCNASNVMYQQHSGKFNTTYWLESKSKVLNIFAF